ncbi:hypothetical protein RJT34_14315 [Clitoria ternatea]|uniref:Uncharacterized protein n=1 Tax=Clitoria ternatea TaxID=43366 RepID=A0AAN9PMK4_CLITE
MGNCMPCHSQPKKQTRVPLIEGRDVEVDAPVPVEKLNSASTKRYILVQRKLQHGEVYHLAPFMMQSGRPEKLNSASTKRYILVQRKLQHGEVDHLAPFMMQSGRPLLPCRTTENIKLKSRNLKIVVRAEQLELLLSGSRNFQMRSVRENTRMRRCRKWLPSLPTIKEVQNY